MCTYIANDLDDIERDRINHPERPLPRDDITTSLAAVLYFICMGAALFTTRAFVPLPIAFGYYFLLAVCISYRYVVDIVPSFKAPYVAVAFSLPIAILACYYPTEARLYIIAASVLIFTLGKELCMDLLDRRGDDASSLHKVDVKLIARIGFSLQGAGLLLLVVVLRNLYDRLAFTAMALFFAASMFLWFQRDRQRYALAITRLHFIVGMRLLV